MTDQQATHWTNPLRNVFVSCLPCTNCGNRPSSPDIDGNGSPPQSGQQPTASSGRHIFARDELEGLLASYSSDEDGGDTLSLHSNFGGQSNSKSRGGGRKRKGKKKAAWGITGRRDASSGSGKVIQVFGWYLFGKPAIALPEDEDEDRPINTSGPSRPRSSSVLSTSAPDAAPLATSTIARLGFAEEQDHVARLVRAQSFEPTKTVEELDREEQDLAEREERYAAAEVERARVVDLTTTTRSSSTSSPTPSRADEHAKRIRRAAREQRKRLKEEANRMAQEEFERRADAAAGGFGEHDSREFGEFVTYQPDASTEESLSEMTSAHSQLTPAVTQQGEEEEDDDAHLGDYGAEYASHRNTQDRKRNIGGSMSDGLERQSADSGSSSRAIRKATRPAFVPLPPSTTGSNDYTTQKYDQNQLRHARSQSSSGSSANGRTHKRISLSVHASPAQFDGVPGGLVHGDVIVHKITSGGDLADQEEEFDGVHF